MGKLLKSYIMPHAPVIVREVGKDDHVFCRKTHEHMSRIGREISELKPKRIIVLSPHGPLFSDAISVLGNNKLEGDFEEFDCKEMSYEFDNDSSFVNKLKYLAMEDDIYVAKVDSLFCENYDISPYVDYGALVPLHFVDEYYLAPYEVVIITYGLLDLIDIYKFGTLLRKSIEESSKSTVVIASSDLAHISTKTGGYRNNLSASIYDLLVQGVLRGDKSVFDFVSHPKKDIEKSKTCSFQTLVMFWGMFDRKMFKSEILSYEHPFGVGYLTAVVEETDGISPSLLPAIGAYNKDLQVKLSNAENPYVDLAKDTLKYYIKYERRPIIDEKKYNIPMQTSACFVSFYDYGSLRASIGTIAPSHNSVVQDIITNTIEAANTKFFQDVTEEDVDEMKIVVDLVDKVEKIKSHLELYPEVYGVIVKSGEKVGVVLPDLRDVDTAEQQLSIALEKAGIKKYDYYQLYRFQVTRHEVDI